MFYGQQEQVEATEQFLRNNVVEIDIFALRNGATGEFIAPLGAENRIAARPGEDVTVEVVASNRNAAHSFPPEVRDLYEAWIEFEVLDSAGKRFFHSGYIKPDGMLDESAHVYKQIILDEQGRQITRHQIWTTNIKAYDNAIQAGRSDVVRFRFRLPGNINNNRSGRPLPISVRARVNYRRLNQEYTNYVLSRQKRQMPLPIIKMAEAFVTLRAQERVREPIELGLHSQPSALSRRWNDYGIGLLEQAQYGAAADAFLRASGLNPRDSNLLINAAIAEMRTERLAHDARDQLRKAELLIERALTIEGMVAIDPAAQWRARYFRALIWRADGKIREAADEFERIASAFPRDREVQRQLAQTLYTLGRFTPARDAFEAILKIDPTDFIAYQFLAPLYLREGRQAEADFSRELYLQWRDDPQASGIAGRFFTLHPQWSDERIGLHVHDADSPRRPVLVGKTAAPDQ